MPIYALDDQQPQLHSTAFIAPSADVIGRVTIEAQANIWFGVVLRGDRDPIIIGERSNVQDGAILHTDPGFPCTLAKEVTIGHRAIVHGASCAAGSLVGMGAIMLNGSSLGEGAILGAGALLPEGQHVPAGMLAMGIPAKVIRPIDTPQNAPHYVTNAKRYQKNLQKMKSPNSLPSPLQGDLQ